MDFDTWLEKAMPNKPNNFHTTFSVNDMKASYYAGGTYGIVRGEPEMEVEEVEEVKEKSLKAKPSSLIAQIIAALWIAVWSGKKFMTSPFEITDIIISGFSIAACFVPVYFNLILDKIKQIKFGD